MLSYPPRRALHSSIHSFSHPTIHSFLSPSHSPLKCLQFLQLCSPQHLGLYKPFCPGSLSGKTPPHPLRPDLGLPSLTSGSQRPYSCLIWIIPTSWPLLLLDSAYNIPLSFISCSFHHHSLQGAAQMPLLMESPLTSSSRISPLWLTPGVWGPLRTLSTSCLVSYPPCELFGQKEERGFPWHLARCWGTEDL